MTAWSLVPNWVLPLLLMAAPALGAETDENPSAMLRTAVGEMLAIAYPASAPATPASVAAQARPVLARTMDFEAITRRAMGSGWRQFSAAERARAVDLFTALMVRTYARRLTEGDRPTIDYRPAVALAPDRWEVTTHVIRDGARYEIVYRIVRLPDGLRVNDIVTEGVSFVASYRAQFDALFQKGGAAAVLRALEVSPRAPE